MCRYFGALCSIFISGVSRKFTQLTPPLKMELGVLKCCHIKFRCWGTTQKKEYNIQTMAKVLNPEGF
jgi:hypothetical protein